VQLINKVPWPRAARNDQDSLRRIRVALTAFFAMDGFVFASWAVRIPAVKTAVGASPATLGLALLGVSAGAIATMAITGALCRRIGSATVTVAAATWLSLALLLPPLAHSALTLGLGLAVFGIGYGGLNVAMNAVAVDVVKLSGRPIMPSFHAAWSFGGLAGSGLGGLLAPLLAPFPHLAIVAAAGLIVTAACGPAVHRITRADPVAAELTAPETGTPETLAPKAGRIWGAVVLAGAIALCGSYGEGAISDWGALHLRQDLGVSAGLAAAGYAAFALAEASGRLAGSALLARFGLTRVLVLGGLTAGAGMLLAALAPVFAVALAGFALTGVGVANLFPAAMTRAGALAGASGVAVASTLGYGGFLLGPPAIGFLASRAGLPAGLTTVSFLAIVASALAYLARDREERKP
jgi:MFS family permease